MADEIDESSQKITATGEAAKEKIKRDVPTPIRSRAHESAGRDFDHCRRSSRRRAPRFRKLNSPTRPTRTAPKTENHEADARLRVGIFGSGGSPYTSGLSTSREKEFNPPSILSSAP